MAKKKEQVKEVITEKSVEKVILKHGDCVIILNSTGIEYSVSSKLAETLINKGAAILK